MQPRLRFPEYQNQSLSKGILSDFSIINPKNDKLPEKFYYIDLESVSEGRLLYLNEEKKDEAPSRAQRILQKGDIIYQMVRPYQRNNLFFDFEGTFVASTGYAQIRAKCNNEYLYQYLHTDIFVNKVLKDCTGSSYPAINSNSLAKIDIQIPKLLEEQQKIASFLTIVDKRIELLIKKKEELEQYKKGIMQKIFNQEFHFKNNNGDDFPEWKEVKLSTLGRYIGGGTPDSSKAEYWEGDIPWISSSDIAEDDIHNINITRFITRQSISESATKLIPKDSLMIVSRVGIGKFAVAKIDLCTSQDFTNIIIDNDKFDSFFLAYLFVAKKKRFVRLSQGTSIKGFTLEDIKDAKFKMPENREEQLKIASFLSAIDKKIEIEKSRIDSMLDWKKGLLQQMFV